MSRARSWVATINNPSYAVGARLVPDAVFECYQLEKGENGTPHFQAVFCFDGLKSLKQVKAYLPSAHWEVRKGTLEQAITYCSKADTRVSGPYEFGEKPKQGRRSDLEALRTAIRSGSSELDIADNYFQEYLRYGRGINSYRLLVTPQRSTPTIAIVYWGPSQTGKSRHAFELGGADAFWLTKPNSNTGSLWFDGYTGQHTVVIDEFYGWIPIDTLQRLIDRYPFQVQTKGGSVSFVSKRIIITSNQPPDRWYSRVGYPRPLQRRLEEPFGYVFYVGQDSEDPNSKLITEEAYRKTFEGPAAFAPGFRRAPE